MNCLEDALLGTCRTYGFVMRKMQDESKYSRKLGAIVDLCAEKSGILGPSPHFSAVDHQLSDKLVEPELKKPGTSDWEQAFDVFNTFFKF